MSHAGPWVPTAPRDRVRFAALACIASLAGATGSAAAAERPGTIRAFDRSIPLDTYLSLAHAESVFVDQRARRVYLAQAHGDTKRLAQLTLPRESEPTVDFAAAQPVSPVDLSKRNFWGAAYSRVLGRTLILTDEAGEERTNLYAVEPDASSA
jgi:hypothetical protein